LNRNFFANRYPQNHHIYIFFRSRMKIIVGLINTLTGENLTPFNHHLVKISTHLTILPQVTILPREIFLCVLQHHPAPPMFQHIILNDDCVTFYPTGHYKMAILITNDSSTCITVIQNDTLDTITSRKNVRFSFGFISENDLQRYVCRFIQ
jgi:hypothetical protein